MDLGRGSDNAHDDPAASRQFRTEVERLGRGRVTEGQPRRQQDEPSDASHHDD